MLAIEIIASRMDYGRGALRAANPVTCAVTGKPTHYPRLLTVKAFPEMPGYGSPYVDHKIWLLMHYRHFRWSSWIIDSRGNVESVRGKGIRKLLFDPPAPPWGAYAASDMRRPGEMYTKANTHNDGAVIQFGSRRCLLAKTRDIYENMELLFWNNEFRKADFANPVEANTKKVIEYGLAAWQQFCAWAGKHIGSAEWELAVWCLPTVEEVKERKEKEDGNEQNEQSV